MRCAHDLFWRCKNAAPRPTKRAHSAAALTSIYPHGLKLFNAGKRSPIPSLKRAMGLHKIRDRDYLYVRTCI